MKIFVPLDGSELAEFAIGNAADIARGLPEPATIVLGRMVQLTPMALAAVEPYATQIVSEAVLAADDYLRTVSYRPSLEGLRCERHVDSFTGSAAEWIAMQAHSHHCDLIVISSHGRGGLAKALLGSTAADVARQSALPTLIFRPTAPPAHDARPSQPFTVLLPLDGTPLAEQAIPVAALVTRALHGRLRLLQVLPTSSGNVAQDRAHMTAAEAYLEPICQRLAHDGLMGECSFAFGDPALQITEQALEGKCDLVVLATHGRGSIERYFVGSVATWLLDHIPTPLLIVRPYTT
ncbi:MAG: universal stress protein [Ktedonobacterales bacterium]|nr:universal stress protein [Ktedonobacterales bacterium]